MIITFSAPIKWKGEIVGNLFKAANGDSLSDFTDQITFGEAGTSYMINMEGTTMSDYYLKIYEN